MIRLALLVAVCTGGVWIATASSAQKDNPVLDAIVGTDDGFNITLNDSSGNKVVTLEPGTYTVIVHDRSALHNRVRSRAQPARPGRARRHAAQHHWVRRARQLPASLRRRLDAFRFAWIHGPPDFMLPLDCGSDLEPELARLRRLPAELVAFEFLRPLWDHGGEREPRVFAGRVVRAHVRRRVRVTGGDPALAQLLFDEPGELRERFLTLLADYWEEAFEREWRRVEPDLRTALGEARNQVASGNVYSLLESLRPRHATARAAADRPVAALDAGAGCAGRDLRGRAVEAPAHPRRGRRRRDAPRRLLRALQPRAAPARRRVRSAPCLRRVGRDASTTEQLRRRVGGCRRTVRLLTRQTGAR